MVVTLKKLKSGQEIGSISRWAVKISGTIFRRIWSLLSSVPHGGDMVVMGLNNESVEPHFILNLCQNSIGSSELCLKACFICGFLSPSGCLCRIFWKPDTSPTKWQISTPPSSFSRVTPHAGMLTACRQTVFPRMVKVWPIEISHTVTVCGRNNQNQDPEVFASGRTVSVQLIKKQRKNSQLINQARVKAKNQSSEGKQIQNTKRGTVQDEVNLRRKAKYGEQHGCYRREDTALYKLGREG